MTLPPPFEPDPKGLGAWELPMEATEPVPSPFGESFLADSVTVAAGVVTGPLGPLPSLRISFASSAQGDGPTVVLVGDDRTMRATGKLVAQAADLANQAARKAARGRP